MADSRKITDDSWLMDNRMIDGQGDLVVMYHGSPRRPGRPAFGDQGNEIPSISQDGRLFFITSNYPYAEMFARGGRVSALHAKIKNPADLDDPCLVEELLEIMRSDPADDITLAVMDYPESADDVEGSAYFLLESKSVLRYLKEKGYDGARMKEDVERNVVSYVVFHPSQIRLISRTNELRENKDVEAEKKISGAKSANDYLLQINLKKAAPRA